jgi:nucleoside-specific outer membrane channel protein Tsx
MKTPEHQQLATLVYIHAMKKQIEEEVKSKYEKRIEYLVGANNELMIELEHWENEIITVSKENADEYDGEGGVNDGDGFMEEGV